MVLRIQIAKYQLRAELPNLMLTKVTHYSIRYDASAIHESANITQ